MEKGQEVEEIEKEERADLKIRKKIAGSEMEERIEKE